VSTLSSRQRLAAVASEQFTLAMTNDANARAHKRNEGEAEEKKTMEEKRREKEGKRKEEGEKGWVRERERERERMNRSDAGGASRKVIYG
jgi:hypothetical protein